jgi:hypothetical protein
MQDISPTPLKEYSPPAPRMQDLPQVSVRDHAPQPYQFKAVYRNQSNLGAGAKPLKTLSPLQKYHEENENSIKPNEYSPKPPLLLQNKNMNYDYIKYG